MDIKNNNTSKNLYCDINAKRNFISLLNIIKEYNEIQFPIFNFKDSNLIINNK